MHEFDEFEHRQLEHVISVCQSSRSLSDAGRRLFNVSRLAKKQPTDADRLRKYLARFDLNFSELRDADLSSA
jgi:transcriptional regulatory protein RtcR